MSLFGTKWGQIQGGEVNLLQLVTPVFAISQEVALRPVLINLSMDDKINLTNPSVFFSFGEDDDSPHVIIPEDSVQNQKNEARFPPRNLFAQSGRSPLQQGGITQIRTGYEVFRGCPGRGPRMVLVRAGTAVSNRIGKRARLRDMPRPLQNHRQCADPPLVTIHGIDAAAGVQLEG